jgi:branched-chain amino acid transport system permease protein
VKQTEAEAPAAAVAALDGWERRRQVLRDSRSRLLGAGARRSLLVVAAAVLIGLPIFVQSLFTLQLFMLAFINAAATAGLVVSFGYAGLLNLSQATFVGVGAYTTAALVTDHGFPFEIAVLCAMGSAALAGLVLGLASLRVHGDYFSLVSLAFTLAGGQVFANWVAVTRGPEGFFGIPEVSFLGLSIDPGITAYFAGLALLGLAVVVAWAVLRTFAGRAMLSVRYDPIAASANGVSVAATRMLALAIGSAIAGAAGAVQVATIRFISPGDFDLISGFNIMVWVIIGGMTSLTGAVITAGAITIITGEFLQLNEYRLLMYSLVVLAAVLVRGGVVRDVFARWRRSAAG